MANNLLIPDLSQHKISELACEGIVKRGVLIEQTIPHRAIDHIE